MDDLRNDWFDPLFRAEAMRRIFSDRARLQGILDFEAALARAQARAGIVPDTFASSIAGHCQAEGFDLPALAQASAVAGNPAIPVIKALQERVGATHPMADQFVHLGATSQDAMDTGLVLQIRQALDWFDGQLRRLCEALTRLATQHRQTPLAGRTWLQHAAPTTFGLKVAGWLGAVARSVERLRTLRSRVLVLQLGGATGTLVALGARAGEVTTFLAEELKLGVPELPWHAHRDRLVALAAEVGVLAGSLGKMARDMSLMAQAEIAEISEPEAPGRGGSSSMPQKRNPVGCAAVLATATRMPGLVSTLFAALTQEHERGLGGWQAEWEALPEIFLLVSGALWHMNHIVAGLHVDAARMRANLEATRGLIYAQALSTALGGNMGPTVAHDLVEKACRRAVAEGRHLREVAAEFEDIAAHFSGEQLAALFDPEPHVRAASRLVDQALEAAQHSRAQTGEV